MAEDVMRYIDHILRDTDRFAEWSGKESQILGNIFYDVRERSKHKDVLYDDIADLAFSALQRPMIRRFEWQSETPRKFEEDALYDVCITSAQLESPPPFSAEPEERIILLTVPASADNPETRAAIDEAKKSLPENVKVRFVEGGSDAANTREATRLAQKMGAVSGIYLSGEVLNTLINSRNPQTNATYLEDTLAMISLHVFACENPDIVKVDPDTGEITEILDPAKLNGMTIERLREISLRLNNSLPRYVLNAMDVSLYNIRFQTRVARELEKKPLPVEVEGYLKELEKKGEKVAVSARVNSLRELKIFAESYRYRRDHFQGTYPVVPHIRLALSKEDLAQLHDNKTALLETMGIADVIRLEDIELVDAGIANTMTIGQIYDQYLSGRYAPDHVVIIDQDIRCDDADKGRLKDAIIAEYQRVLDARVYDMTVNLRSLPSEILASPEGPKIPGVQANRERGFLLFIVEGLPEYDTETSHEELRRYRRAIINGTKDF